MSRKTHPRKCAHFRKTLKLKQSQTPSRALDWRTNAFAGSLAIALLAYAFAHWKAKDDEAELAVRVSSPVKYISTATVQELADIPPEALSPRPPIRTSYNAHSSGLPTGVLRQGVVQPGMPTLQGARNIEQGYGGYDGIRQQFTGKERDNESGLDYLINRYYSATQARFTSVDPDNAGANPHNPQSWNGYAYALNNPLKYQDPDGLAVKICDTNGHCTDADTHLSDDNFNRRFKGDKSIRLKNGNIYKDGELIGTYKILSIDGAPWSSALPLAGQRPYEKGVLAFAGVSVAGGLLGSVIIPTGGVTTLGLGTTATSTAVSGVSLTSLSLQQLNLMIRGTQRQLLSEMFGQGMAGAQSALASGQIPAGLTRQTLLVAKEITQRAVGTIKDKGGVQAVRLKVIEEALKKVK